MWYLKWVLKHQGKIGDTDPCIDVAFRISNVELARF